MAVALSLLIVLPGLAQSQNYDDTRGKLSSGSNLTVAVIDGDTLATGVDVEDDAGIADSYFNGNLYVSNDEDAHNRVQINATTTEGAKEFPGPDGELGSEANDTTQEQRDLAMDNFDCDGTATVVNNNSNREITVYMDDVSNLKTAIFEVISSGEERADGTCADLSVSPAVDEVPGKIPARHGDTLTITVAGVSGSVTIKVDADGPEFTEISPEDGAYLSSQTVKFRFVATDSDSGLAHDGELDYTRGDTDARAINGDDDNFTTGEPRANDDGDARYISVELDGDDRSEEGTSGWRQRGGRPGVFLLPGHGRHPGA